MRYIFCLIGRSGSGKTVVSKKLEKKGYNVVQSYTTRKQREPNEFGHVFMSFTSQKEQNQYIEMLGDWVIAFEEIHNDKYWSEMHQFHNHINIYSISPRGVELLKKDDKIGGKVITIFLNVSTKIAIERLIKDSREIDDIMTKIKNDNGLFTFVKCDYAINVDDLSVENIVDYIVNIIEKEVVC